MSQAIVDTNHPINKMRKLFVDDTMLGPSLLLLASKIMTIEDIQTFDPKAIRLEVQEALRIPFIPLDTFDRLMASITILNTDMFFKDVAVFNDMCNLLSGFPTNPDEFEPCEPVEMAFAIHQARMIDPLDGTEDDIEFSDDVKLYMGAILAENGYISVPTCLKDAVIPDKYLSNASSFLGDAAYMPSILDNTQMLITDLEDELKTMVAVLDDQMEQVKTLPDFTPS